MKRKEFLEKIGIGAAFALTATCLGGCSKDMSPLPKDIDFTIDLTAPENLDLNLPGRYVIVDEIVIARSINGSNKYVAATIYCSHERFPKITYRESDGIWSCSVHGATFDEDGIGVSGPSSTNLTIFNTELLDGKNLRIFS